jgi:hypothetical protein
MKEKSNFKYLLDWISDNFVLIIILVCVILSIWSVGPCAR